MPFETEPWYGYQVTPFERPKLTRREWVAIGAFLAGLGSAYAIYLAATGRQQQAYILGITGAITGATFTAVRLLDEKIP